jgi:NAD-dependent DNA ligase
MSLAASVDIELPEVPEVVEGSPLVTKTVVFTGELAAMPREDAQKLVRRLGGLTPDGLTRDTDILVIGSLAKDAQRGKRDKAEHHNAKGARISILDEAAFLEMIKDFR